MYSVLIIDDKEVFRRKVMRMNYFKEHAEHIEIKYTAQNGEEALEILEKEQVDIVLTDIRMPIMDGIELLKIIKERKLCTCTILVSEYSDFVYAKEGIVNGAFDYIVKPVEEENIRDVLNRAMEFLETSKQKMTPIDNLIEITANAVISLDERIDEVVRMLIEGIRTEAGSLLSEKNLANFVLNGIGSLLVKGQPEMVNYLPMKDICYIDSPTEDYEQLEKNVKFRIGLMRHEMELILPKTDSKIAKDICHYVITNIDKRITLQTITDEFFLNKKY